MTSRALGWVLPRLSEWIFAGPGCHSISRAVPAREGYRPAWEWGGWGGGWTWGWGWGWDCPAGCWSHRQRSQLKRLDAELTQTLKAKNNPERCICSTANPCSVQASREEHRDNLPGRLAKQYDAHKLLLMHALEKKKPSLLALDRVIYCAASCLQRSALEASKMLSTSLLSQHSCFPQCSLQHLQTCERTRGVRHTPGMSRRGRESAALGLCKCCEMVSSRKA